MRAADLLAQEPAPFIYPFILGTANVCVQCPHCYSTFC